MSKRSSSETISKTPNEDAERLRVLFSVCEKSQSDFADEFGIGSQAQLWQFMNPEKKGGRPLNISAALGFARGLNCKVGDFSPSLQEFIDCVSDYASLQKTSSVALKIAQNSGLYQFTNESTAAVVSIMERIDEHHRRLVLDHAEYICQRYISDTQNSKQLAGQ